MRHSRHRMHSVNGSFASIIWGHAAGQLPPCVRFLTFTSCLNASRFATNANQACPPGNRTWPEQQNCHFEPRCLTDSAAFGHDKRDHENYRRHLRTCAGHHRVHLNGVGSRCQPIHSDWRRHSLRSGADHRRCGRVPRRQAIQPSRCNC